MASGQGPQGVGSRWSHDPGDEAARGRDGGGASAAVPAPCARNQIGGGTFFGTTVLGGTVHITCGDAAAPPAPAPPPLAAPPVPVTGFTGRDDDLATLLSVPAPHADGGRATGSAASAPGASPPAIPALVLGTGGIGKTTLALTAAHAALKRGLVPGSAGRTSRP
ncbi:hypothetical protein [Kitasatospora sp. NPDC050467]|uniref:hypothetical protein n=1 Tax=unclassified Kitasatospora TaxID=2633591 RepID=UPI0032465B5F